VCEVFDWVQGKITEKRGVALDDKSARIFEHSGQLAREFLLRASCPLYAKTYPD